MAPSNDNYSELKERIDSLYAWTEIDPEKHREGVIAALGVLGPNQIMLLQHRSRAIAEKLRPYAEGHRKASGHVVRLVRFARMEDLEILP